MAYYAAAPASPVTHPLQHPPGPSGHPPPAGGFGPWLYDLAMPLSEVRDRPSYPALLAGYRRVRPLPTAHEALLDTFIALRYVQNALWALEHGPRDEAGGWRLKVRRNLAALASLLVQKGRFSGNLRGT